MPTLDDRIAAIARTLRGLDPGPLAELRRMEPDGPGTAHFWRLHAEHEFADRDMAAWRAIVRIMAILCPKGAPDTRGHLHDRKRPLGEALCDGGDPGWPGDGAARPVLSEKRLAHFLALPPAARPEALERMARMLARSRSEESGIDCTGLARLLLEPNNPELPGRIARAYYDRLDRAERARPKEGTTP
jgi:hypothetical protein